MIRSAHLVAILAAASLMTVPRGAAIAADASPWDEEPQSAARLLAARAKDEGGVHLLRAGLEIRLKQGWKTYWRYPGDSGVPPAFDFSRSQNVESVAVLYPAPGRFPDGAGGHSIGYARDVILPIHVVARDPRQPVLLDLKLDYAACEKLCVPATASLQLLIDGKAGREEAAVSAAEARVPQRSEIGAPGVPAIRAVQRQDGAGKPRIVVDVAAPDQTPVALFAEGPTSEWALPLPEPVAGGPTGIRRFAFDLDGLPPGASASGALLRLTAVAGEQAIEVQFRLD